MSRGWIPYGPGYWSFRDESCLGVKGEARKNQIKTDSENARPFQFLLVAVAGISGSSKSWSISERRIKYCGRSPVIVDSASMMTSAAAWQSALKA